MPPFGNKEREKMIMQVAEVMLPVVYIGHASNFTRRDDGGYADAIMDIKLALNGVPPKRRDWWDEPDKEESDV
ncbi:hypothetical protein LCGC14_2965160 [marine sediment metagenome]|uniref:Uncharacterized protein n=1 Tax=marine sediment metagenome TaxID=412755 RepID=A0A0F8ZIS9_9ZZZZ